MACKDPHDTAARTTSAVLFYWPQLFEGWITLSSGYIAIQWISVKKTNHAISRIVICPLDRLIHPSNTEQGPDLFLSVRIVSH